MSKVLKLVASNVKRLTAIEITPDGTLTTIGGKNGAGKSSVLDAIAYAAGGSKLIPDEPIRKGETKAEIEVTLNDHIIVRKFTRDKIYDCPPGPADHVHTEACPFKFGPIRSGLAVKTREGASYPSPQSVLDELFGQLTFDPLAFFTMSADKQRETIRKLVGLDTGEIDFQIKETYDKRTEVNRELTKSDAHTRSLTLYENVPAQEISVAEVSKEMLEAEQLRKAADEYDRQLEKLLHEDEQAAIAYESVDREINELENRLADLREKQKERAMRHLQRNEKIKEMREVAASARAKVPDVGALQARLSEVDLLNQKVRANKVREESLRKTQLLNAEAAGLTARLSNLAEKRQAMFESLKFPVEGLGFDNNLGVLWNGIPLSQASTAEQLRISVAIGMALNPKVKVLLIRNGNSLDEDSLKAITQMAEERDYQIWMEWVTKSADGVSVLIEDGHVVG